ncbi:MAG: hypothetical protein NXI24_05885 [bacterium]|nr:hypothetical protein [bacterium]
MSTKESYNNSTVNAGVRRRGAFSPRWPLAGAGLLAILLYMYAGDSHFVKTVAQTPAPAAKQDAAPETTENVVMIVLDGVRTEEFFIGANPYASKRGPAQAKEKLFPFLWGELGARAQSAHSDSAKIETRFFGDRFRRRGRNRDAAGPKDGLCRIDNNYGISLPAYADLLGGVRQPTVRSNTFQGRLPHPTVLDRLLEHGFVGSELAVFSSWKHIASVVSATPPVDFHVNTGRQSGDRRPRWKDARYDRDLHKAVMGYLGERTDRGAGPLRFLFVAYNDSDEWAHIGNYGRYLNAMRRQDAYIRELYGYLESQPDYRAKTLYIITTDHGRGRGRHWKSHGRIPGSQYIWAMIHAPGQSARLTSLARALGERCSHTTLGDLAYAAATGEDPDLAANY